MILLKSVLGAIYVIGAGVTAGAVGSCALRATGLISIATRTGAIFGAVCVLTAPVTESVLHKFTELAKSKKFISKGTSETLTEISSVVAAGLACFAAKTAATSTMTLRTASVLIIGLGVVAGIVGKIVDPIKSRQFETIA